MEDRNLGQQSSGEDSLHESGEGQQEDVSSSSSHPFAVGRRVPGCLIPTVEALILARNLKDDGTFDLSLLLAPYIKKGVWVKAAVHVRNSKKISKRVIEKYTYALPWAAKLSLEAVRNKGDSEWIRLTLADINHSYTETVRATGTVEPEVLEEGKSIKKSLVKHKVISSSESVGSFKGQDSSPPHRVSRRSSHHVTRFPHWSSRSSDGVTHHQRPLRKKKQKKKKSIWPSSPRSRRAAAKAVRSSSSDSSESSLKETQRDVEVGDSEHEDDGLVYCPFTHRDIRRFIDVKESIKSKSIERRYIRQALHNLYRHYTSLQTFVDSIRSRVGQGSGHPYPSELVWLEHHAIYIDCLLFESLHGMWGLWQEPVLDLLVMSFLELVVRCSPRRQYPEKLEERVRKWMKKNRIGISSSYGPIPFFLQNAKVSERGVLVNSGSFERGRTAPPFIRQHESRGRGSSYSGFTNRRGSVKSDSKAGSHE